MQNLIKEIQTRICTEKLLFTGDVDYIGYSLEECELITSEVLKLVEKNNGYLDLIALYEPKLFAIVNNVAKAKGIDDNVYSLMAKLNEWDNKHYNKKTSDADYIHYCNEVLYGYPSNETYSEVIKNRIINVTDVRGCLDNHDINHNKTNFLITSNFLLNQYPQFFDDADLEQLTTLVKESKLREFVSLHEYRDFKKAAKATLKNVENFKTGKIKTKFI